MAMAVSYTHLTLNMMADKMLSNEETPKHLLKYAHMWKRMYDSFVENPNGEDKLFFKAPLLIIVKAQNEIDGGLASAKMELMVDALGLGTVSYTHLDVYKRQTGRKGICTYEYAFCNISNTPFLNDI